jgi:hypothetical protein
MTVLLCLILIITAFKYLTKLGYGRKQLEKRTGDDKFKYP